MGAADGSSKLGAARMRVATSSQSPRDSREVRVHAASPRRVVKATKFGARGMTNARGDAAGSRIEQLLLNRATRRVLWSCVAAVSFSLWSASAWAAPCATSTQCSVPEPVCDTDAGQCAACGSDFGGASLACPTSALPACRSSGTLAGRCTECSGTNGTRCASGYSSAVCVALGVCGYTNCTGPAPGGCSQFCTASGGGTNHCTETACTVNSQCASGACLITRARPHGRRAVDAAHGAGRGRRAQPPPPESFGPPSPPSSAPSVPPSLGGSTHVELTCATCGQWTLGFSTAASRW